MLIGREPGPDGTYGRGGPGAPLPRDPNDAALWLPGQGRANACGTTTLAYILRHLLRDCAPTRAEIDVQLRRGNIFSAPMLLAAYARRLGLSVRAYNGASIEFVSALIDRGVPVMVLMDTTPLNLRDTANLHWVAPVVRCGDRVGIYNPHGFQEELDLASFQAHWRQARIFGLPAWSNFAIAIGRNPAALPPLRRPGLSCVGANLAASGVAEVVNNAVDAWQREHRTRPLRTTLGVAADGSRVLLGALQALVGSVMLLTGAAIGYLASLRQRYKFR
jgi:hypothetical protein